MDGGGGYDDDHVITMFGSGASLGDVSGKNNRMSFTDTYSQGSSTRSRLGLDDYLEGWGCEDSWEPKAQRAAQARLTIR